MDRPVRKPTRLKEYDYSSPGAYFITVCTRGKKCILSRVVRPHGGDVGAIHESPAADILLTPAGECVLRVLETFPFRWPMISLDRYVIMPNHIHLLLTVDGERAIRESPLQPSGKRSLLDKAVGYLKMNSSREIRRLYPDLEVWQRSYYDHIIRNEDEYREISEYIDGNPAKWADDRFYTDA